MESLAQALTLFIQEQLANIARELQTNLIKETSVPTPRALAANFKSFRPAPTSPASLACSSAGFPRAWRYAAGGRW